MTAQQNERNQRSKKSNAQILDLTLRNVVFSIADYSIVQQHQKFAHPAPFVTRDNDDIWNNQHNNGAVLIETEAFSRQATEARRFPQRRPPRPTRELVPTGLMCAFISTITTGRRGEYLQFAAKTNLKVEDVR